MLALIDPGECGITRKPCAFTAAALAQSDAFVSIVICPVTAAEPGTVMEPLELIPVPANRQRFVSAVSFDVL